MQTADFWASTPREINNRLAGWKELKAQENEEAYKLTRWQTWLTLLPHVKKNSLKSPQDLGALESEKELKIEVDKAAKLDPAAAAELIKKMDEFHRKNFSNKS